MIHVFKGSVQTFGTRIGTFVFNILTIMLLTRILGPDGLGKYVLLTLIPVFLINFGTPAVELSNVYLSGTGKYNPAKIGGNSLIYAVFFSIALSIFVAIASLLPQYHTFLNSKGIEPYLVWLAVASIPFLLVYKNFLSILRGSKYITQFNIVTLASVFIQFVIVSVIYIWGNATLFEIIIGFTLANFASAFLVLIYVNHFPGIKIVWDQAIFKDALKYGSKAYLWNTSLFLDRRLDMLLVGVMLSPLSLGIYAVAVNIIEKLWVVPESVATVLFPYTADSNNKNTSKLVGFVSRHTFILMVVLALLLGIIAKPVITILFGDEFANATLPLRILLPGAVLLSVARLISVGFAGKGKPEIGALSALVSVVVTVALIILLVPTWEINGVAFASTMGYAAATFVIVILFSRWMHLPLKDLFLLNRQDLKDHLKYFRLVVSKIRKNKRVTIND